MALKAPDESVQSIADLALEVSLFGGKVDASADHPVIRRHRPHRDGQRAGAAVTSIARTQSREV